MKITYYQTVNNCDFTLQEFETDSVIRTSGEFVGKDSNGELIHIKIDKIVKIES